MTNAEAIANSTLPLRDYTTARGVLTLHGRAPYEPYDPLTAPIPDTYEGKVSLGIELKGKETALKWALGDLAATVMQSDEISTDLTLTSYAMQIGENPRTLQSRVRMSKYYPARYRDEWPNLYYSHFKDAMGAYPEQLDKALHALEYASLQGMNYAMFKSYLAEIRQSKESALKVENLLLRDTLAMAYRALVKLIDTHDKGAAYRNEIEQVVTVLGLKDKPE